MTDVKIENGDIVLDSSGRTVMLDESAAKVQQALICIRSVKGGFIYNRNLGSEIYSADEYDNLCLQQIELEVNEALACFENTYARIIRCDEDIVLELTIDGKTIREIMISNC